MCSEVNLLWDAPTFYFCHSLLQKFWLVAAIASPRPPSFPRQNTLNLEEFGVHASARMTACHAKCFAPKLTRRCPSDSGGKLAASLADAQADLVDCMVALPASWN